jgi:hypothetical protein
MKPVATEKSCADDRHPLIYGACALRSLVVATSPKEQAVFGGEVLLHLLGLKVAEVQKDKPL